MTVRQLLDHLRFIFGTVVGAFFGLLWYLGTGVW